MQKDPRAVATLVRNRIHSLDLETLHEWLHEKGVSLNHENDLYFLETEEDGHKSELTEFTQKGVIFSKNQMLAYSGKKDIEMSLSEAKNHPEFMWKEGVTYFTEYIDSEEIVMFWHPDKEEWELSSTTKYKNSMKSVANKQITYKMAAEPSFTYLFKLKKGQITLDTIIYNKAFKEESWQKLWDFSVRMKVPCVKAYKFEGFEKIEESDLPLIARDRAGHRIVIKEL